MSAGYDYDFLIVGSGFGGSVSALRLSEKGYRVAVVEAGKRWRSEDYPKTNWSIRKFLWAPRFLCHGIQRLSLLDDVFILSGAGVGGGSLVYANTLLVPSDAAFKNAGWPEGVDWRTELRPHYDTAEKMLGVTDVPGDFPADELLKAAAEKVGRGATYHRQRVGVYFGKPGETVPDPYFGGKGPTRTGCTLCGGCMIGCRHGAKNTLDKNYLYLAEQNGVTIVPETQVDGLVPLPEGGYVVEGKKTTDPLAKKRVSFRARNVVLSAGVLGTMKLLLSCREKGTLPNLSPKLGTGVRTNSESIIGSTARKYATDYTRGVAIASSVHIDDATHVEAVRYGKGSDAMAMLGTLLADGGKLPRPAYWLQAIAKRPTDFARTLNPMGWAERTLILLVMQSVESSLELGLERTALGERLRTKLEDGAPKIPTYLPQANEFARVVAELQDGYPSTSIFEMIFDVPMTAHILGGARLGTSPERGVIGLDHQVFGHPGLYVIDGSVVPSNLGVNPSLTITALAERAAARIPPRSA